MHLKDLHLQYSRPTSLFGKSYESHNAVLVNKAETKWCDLLRQRVSSGLGNPSQRKKPFHFGIWGRGEGGAQIDFDTFRGENNSETLL